MPAGVLNDVVLGYQLLWNAQRQVAGVLLTLDAAAGHTLAIEPLLHTVGQLWGSKAPALTLSTPSPGLLTELLQACPTTLASLMVDSMLLDNPAMLQHVQHAGRRGLKLVWHANGDNARLMPGTAMHFSQSVSGLSVDDTLLALRLALRGKHGTPGTPGTQSLHQASPVQAGKIYQDIASRTLAEHCLDEQAASALLGWPVEDVLHGYRQSGIQPGQGVMRCLVKAIDSDASMDDIEFWLGQDPVLAYRFLRYTNSAGLGLSREIDALRQGLMVLGLSHTKKWLLDLLPHAAHDSNLQPVRQAMVLRATFMADLLDAGESEALKRELYLCGLLSQIDQLVAEPMANVLASIPLPSRVKEAIAGQTGPYWPFLEVATATESTQLDLTLARCQQHSFDLEEVNLVLLRTLATLK